MLSFILNQRPIRTDERSGMVLLEFVRDVTCLSGTKEACREGECGAGTVLIGRPRPDGTVSYQACASCLLPIGDVAGCHVVTVEGLLDSLTLVQQLIVDHSASQCGFCTPGIVLSLTGYALTSPTLCYDDAVTALDGNICRCTGYVAIRNAARALSERLRAVPGAAGGRVAALVAAGVLPEYFLAIPAQLAKLRSSPEEASDAAVFVAGGTDLFVQKPEALLEQDLCFLSQRLELQYTRVDGDVLRVGGATSIEDFRLSAPVQEHFPALTRDLLLHSSTILRNKATLSGNIVNASPIGDVSIALLALDARLGITSRTGAKSEVALADFFLGYKKVAMGCGDLVSEIAIPLLPAGARYHFEKVSNRTTLDIAAVNSAMRLIRGPSGEIRDLRISAGGVGPVPFLIPGLASFQGRKLDAATIEAIGQVAESAAKPIDDIRGSATYKKLLLRQLVRAHFSEPAVAEVAR